MDPYSLALTRDEALVLFDWLRRTGEAEQPAVFEDQAEQRVLWDLLAELESVLVEPLEIDYKARLGRARAAVRDPEE